MRTRRRVLGSLLFIAVMVAFGDQVVAQHVFVGPGTPIVPHGSAQSSPDAVGWQNNPAMYVVTRGTDNNIWRARTDDGLTWTGWEFGSGPPGGFKGDPAIVSWGFSRVDVFVRGADDKLWQSFQLSAGDGWTPWFKPLGDDGVLASGPEASSRGPGRLDVFVLGTDGQIYQRFWDSDSWNHAWLALGDPAGATSLVGEPTSVSQDASRVDIFGRGSDHQLWQRSWDGQAWSDWVRPVGNEGTLTSSPDATSHGPGHIAVLVRGTDDNLWLLQLGGIGTFGGWSGWTPAAAPGPAIQDAPGLTRRSFSQLVGFARRSDNLVYLFASPLAVP